MNTRDYMQQRYDYNYWANHRHLAVAEGLTEEQLHRRQGHSWDSVHAVLVHMLSSEWVWLERWQGRSPRALPDGFTNLAELRSELEEIEKGQKKFLEGLTPARMDAPISYVNFKGEPWTYALGDALVHLVNHGSYHRGQVATLLRQLGKAPLATDYLLFLEGKAK